MDSTLLVQKKDNQHFVSSNKSKSSIHLVLDNHTAAKAVLDHNAQITQRPRPGELGRAALRLGDAGINKYGYGGTQARDELRLVSFSLAANLDWQPYVG
jgi:hypothetical protein